MSNDRLTDPYLIGFKEGMEHGYRLGWNDSNAQAESQAELAARFFYAMEAGDEIHRKAARSAHDAIDVVASREKMMRGENR